MVTTICYNTEKKWRSRNAAIRFFEKGVRECYGSEQERYLHVLDELRSGAEVCTDGRSVLKKGA